jgi:hypothetical protein
MFNKQYIDNSYRSPSKIEVIEKRAPTDQSVKLLSEFEQAAMNKIVAMGKVEDNIFNAKWYITSDYMAWVDRCRCIFTMNGKEHDFEFRLPGKFDVSNSKEYIEYMKGEVMNKLTIIFLDDLFIKCEKQLMDSFRSRR